MSKLLASVDMRTNLAGKNRMELLIFYLADHKQPYGINVFKVKEVYQNPNLTILPEMNKAIVGVTHFRGRTIPVIDIGAAMGMPPQPLEGDRIVITSEFNRRMQGLLVSDVHRIVNIRWEDIQTPPKFSGGNTGSYIIAITEIDEKLVEIVDVEKILEEVSPDNEDLREDIVNRIAAEEVEIIIADDSLVARKKIRKVLNAINVKVTEFKTGKETWDHFNELGTKGINPADKYLLLISDIEMPEMDGYTLVSNIRSHEKFKDMHVVMHSSMSGEFNEAMIGKVGADAFLPKFEPNSFADKVIEIMKLRGMN